MGQESERRGTFNPAQQTAQGPCQALQSHSILELSAILSYILWRSIKYRKAQQYCKLS